VHPRPNLVALLATLLASCTDDRTNTSDDETAATETSDSDSTGSESQSETTSDTDSSDSSETAELPEMIEREVVVLLDGVPLEGAQVIQGGTGVAFETDAEGRVVVVVDTTIPGDLGLMASHELARTEGQFVVLDDPSPMLFELDTIEPGDNEDYVFNPPGLPGMEGTTAECGHCHDQLKTDWYGSPHRISASNVAVQDVYAGVATAYADQASCEGAGGQWWIGVVPGTAELAPRCYLGVGTLPDLDGECGQVAACDEVATQFGACADCHAPAIDGPIGGRDLLAATGTAYEAGVHCDLCHKVESIDPLQKGLTRLRVVGQSTVVAVMGDQVEFDVPLPPGDIAFRGRPDWFSAADPLDAAAVAGAPGFAFARVLADDDGQIMVPHHRAVDVVSDNRILPASSTS
jgi:hypothetical protein